MSKLKTLSRLLAPVALMALAACQTTQQPGSGTATPSTSAPAAVEPSTPAESMGQTQGQEMAAPLLVFLADTKPHADWAEVQIDESNVLYMEPNAFLARHDLTSVEAGSAETGEGLLALTLTDSAAQRLTALTTRHTGKRLALVVDGTLLAIPGFSEPITEGRLIFMVGTKENAVIAAQIIAGEEATPMQ